MEKRTTIIVIAVLVLMALVYVRLTQPAGSSGTSLFVGSQPKVGLTYKVATDKTCSAETDCRQYYAGYGVSSGDCLEGKCFVDVVA